MDRGTAVDTPVVVVGRGPVGMTTALLLAQWGVASTLVDPLDVDTVTPGSKAVLIAGHAIAVTEPTGVGGRIAAEGLAWQVSRTFIRCREVAATRVAARPGLLPGIVNLPQKRVEELLLAQVLAEPLVTLRSETRVVGLRNADDHVRVTVETEAGREELTCGWLVGADGSRSTVRTLLGIPFEGYGLDEQFVIVDIAAELPFPAERHFHFDPPHHPGRTVLIHPQPGNTWHIDWQVGPEVDVEEELASGRLDAQLRAIVGDADYELLWRTTYRFKQLRAKEFRRGRCLLVGDAAHLTSPYGARGMNSGLADAENAAWRLGLAITGHADELIVDAYSPERVHASEENLAITGATARFMCPPTRRARLRQKMVLRMARAFAPARRWVDSGTFYQPTCYAGERGVGSIVDDAVVRTADPAVTRLGQLLRRGIVLLAFPCAQKEETERTLWTVMKSLPDLPITALTIDRDHVHDVTGALHERWCPTVAGPARIYLVRPDAHIAACLPPDPEAILAAVRRTFALVSR